METCPVTPMTAYFVEFAALTPIVIVLQILLLCHSVYYQFIKRQAAGVVDIKILFRVLSISQQVVGLLWTLNEFFRFVINVEPWSNITQNAFGCILTAYSPKVLPWLYYGIYTVQVLYRVRISFADSFLAMNKRTFKVLLVFFILHPLAFSVLFFVVNDQSVCAHLWDAPEYDEQLVFCGLPSSASAAPVILGALALTLLENIALAVVFSRKLYLLLSQNADNVRVRFQMKSIIFKLCLLTVIGSVSTIAAWLLWLTNVLPFSAVFLYCDVLVNTLATTLMFKYSEGVYKRMCGCCVRLCFLRCDKSKKKLSASQVTRYLDGSMIASMNASTSNVHSARAASPSASPRAHALSPQLPAMQSVQSLSSSADADTGVVSQSPHAQSDVQLCSPDPKLKIARSPGNAAEREQIDDVQA